MGAPYQQHNNMTGGFICIQMNSSQQKIGNHDLAWKAANCPLTISTSATFVAVNITLTLPHIESETYSDMLQTCLFQRQFI